MLGVGWCPKYEVRCYRFFSNPEALEGYKTRKNMLRQAQHDSIVLNSNTAKEKFFNFKYKLENQGHPELSRRV